MPISDFCIILRLPFLNGRQRIKVLKTSKKYDLGNKILAQSIAIVKKTFYFQKNIAMKNLINELHKQGLSSRQIDQVFFTIEEWLEEKYPIMAPLYRKEIVLKEILAREEPAQEPASSY